MKYKNINKLRKKLTIFVLILTFFLLGVLLSDKVKDLFVKNIVNNENQTINFNKNNIFFKTNDLDLNKFWEVYDLVKRNYYSDNQVEKSKLVDGAIKGMIDSLGDKHSEYMTIDETKKFNEVLSGDFEGIGAVVEKIPVGVQIDRLIKGAPAKKAGLKKGDIIIEANGKELIGMDLFDAVNLIKGKAGTSVKLKIIREGESEFLEIDVIRDKIKIPSIETKTLSGSYNQIGYIALNMFGENTSDEFKKALDSFRQKDGIIIDLRDNGGGYLQSAVEILSNFIDGGKDLVLTKYKKSLRNTKHQSINFDGIYDGKLVILINGNSASASEITSGILREYNKAIVVGEKSYGKGSVQEPFSIKDGSLLKITTGKWFTPKDKNIDGEGITPDVKIDFTKKDYEDKYDRQFEISKEIIKDFIDSDNLNLTISKWNNEFEKRGLTKTGSLKK